MMAITMCKLFAAMALGFYLYRRGLFHEDLNRRMSGFIVNVSCPLLVISSIHSVPAGVGSAVFRLIIVSAVCYGAALVFANLAARLLHVPKYLLGTYINMILFANNGFMGFPVVQSVFGDQAIFYMAMANLPFNILIFTYGMHNFRRDAEADKSKGKRAGKESWKRALNNGLIASVLALVIYFAGIVLPDIINEPISFVGNLTSPLSLILIGSSLGAVSMQEIRENKKVFAMLPFRFIAVPLITCCIASLLMTDPMLIAICTIGMGMPVASIVGMASAEYPRQHPTAAIGVSVSTIFSVVTIPVLIGVLTHVLGL